MATLDIEPRTALRSLVQDGTVYVRITAPLGFDFDAGCLAVTPNPVFGRCEGFGRIAVLPAREATLPAGRTTVMLWVTNAALDPTYNWWVLESFLDISAASARTATSAEARQKSSAAGYPVRELLQATIGANTQQGSVTTVFVWFLASRFLDLGGAMELHAPRGYELRCVPGVRHITLPPTSCQLKKGVVASTGDAFHNYLVLTLTAASQLVYPNVAYEFGVSAVNPTVPASPNYWGLIMLNPRKEVVDASMNLEGYQLTDYGLLVHSLLASSTMPAVVNDVTLTLTFQRHLRAGLVGHITIGAPTTTKVLCQRFLDVSGGGSSEAQLPLDPNAAVGLLSTHSCRLQNTITLHLLRTRPLRPLTHVLKLGVLNPGLRATRDYWSVELLPGGAASSATSNTTGNATPTAPAQPQNWWSARPLLHMEVPGYGISSPFSGPRIKAYTADLGSRPATPRVCLLLLLSPVAASLC
uniref:Uncharacterized protein n=1 Tax=Alexandrium monilatum TaxID=311494 RepID=A0A7S4PZD6_9DINO